MSLPPLTLHALNTVELNAALLSVLKTVVNSVLNRGVNSPTRGLLWRPGSQAGDPSVPGGNAIAALQSLHVQSDKPTARVQKTPEPLLTPSKAKPGLII